MKTIFAANWNLFKTPHETEEFFKSWFQLADGGINGEVVFFPTAVCLDAASRMLKDRKEKWGAQNCYWQGQGAFTGENSAATIKSMGASYILIGHSERRSLFGESNALVAEKVAYVQSIGLTPMLCIGETLQEREAGKVEAVVRTQLVEGLSKADRSGSLVVAYEPVWAIGTGKVATPQQVAETHLIVRRVLNELGFNQSPVLYGGSVKPENAKELMQQENVNGFLVGGASLDPKSFFQIQGAGSR